MVPISSRLHTVHVKAATLNTPAQIQILAVQHVGTCYKAARNECSHVCRWYTVNELLDDTSLPEGCLGTTHLLTSICIPPIRDTQYLWSYKVAIDWLCVRLSVDWLYLVCCSLAVFGLLLIGCIWSAVWQAVMFLQ